MKLRNTLQHIKESINRKSINRKLISIIRNWMFLKNESVAGTERYKHQEKQARKKPYFKVGDRVRFHKGGFGTVIQGDALYCDVEWDDFKIRGNPFNSNNPRHGRNISITLPAKNKGWFYNPIIKRAV